MSEKIDFLKLVDVPDISSVDPQVGKAVVISEGEVAQIPLSQLGGGAAALTRSTANIVVPSGQTTGTFNPGKSALFLYFQATDACRFRTYANASARNADLSRPISIFPNANSGLMFEFSAVSGLLSAPLSPGVMAFNSEIPVTDQHYYTVDSDSAVTITLTFITLE